VTAGESHQAENRYGSGQECIDAQGHRHFKRESQDEESAVAKHERDSGPRAMQRRNAVFREEPDHHGAEPGRGHAGQASRRRAPAGEVAEYKHRS
jgi:hypothetical protein